MFTVRGINSRRFCEVSPPGGVTLLRPCCSVSLMLTLQKRLSSASQSLCPSWKHHFLKRSGLFTYLHGVDCVNVTVYVLNIKETFWQHKVKIFSGGTFLIHHRLLLSQKTVDCTGNVKSLHCSSVHCGAKVRFLSGSLCHSCCMCMLLVVRVWRLLSLFVLPFCRATAVLSWPQLS